jgi:hypothetical protein
MRNDDYHTESAGAETTGQSQGDSSKDGQSGNNQSGKTGSGPHDSVVSPDIAKGSPAWKDGLRSAVRPYTHSVRNWRGISLPDQRGKIVTRTADITPNPSAPQSDVEKGQKNFDPDIMSRSFEEQLEAELVRDISGQSSSFDYDDLLAKSEYRIHQNCAEIKELHKQADENTAEYPDANLRNFGLASGNIQNTNMTLLLRQRATTNANRQPLRLRLKTFLTPMNNIAAIALCITIGAGMYFYPEFASQFPSVKSLGIANPASVNSTLTSNGAPIQTFAAAAHNETAQLPPDEEIAEPQVSMTTLPQMNNSDMDAPVVREVPSANPKELPAAMQADGDNIITSTKTSRISSIIEDRKSIGVTPVIAAKPQPVLARASTATAAKDTGNNMTAQDVVLNERFVATPPPDVTNHNSLLRGYLPDNMAREPNQAIGTTKQRDREPDISRAQDDTKSREGHVVQLAMRKATGIDSLDMSQRQALAARLILGECVGEALRQVAGRVSPLLVRDMMRNLDGRC